MARELREELGLEALVGPVLFAEADPVGRHLALFYKATIGDVPRPDGQEIDAFRFVSLEEFSAWTGEAAPGWLGGGVGRGLGAGGWMAVRQGAGGWLEGRDRLGSFRAFWRMVGKLRWGVVGWPVGRGIGFVPHILRCGSCGVGAGRMGCCDVEGGEVIGGRG